MVKAAKTTKPKRPMGRPPLDPGDLRTERIAIRLHPDLYEEVGKAARDAGTNKSLWVEGAVINAINALLMSRGKRPVDRIGKYLSDEALDELQQQAASDAAAAAHYAAFRPALQPSPVPGGLPSWTPPAAPNRKK